MPYRFSNGFSWLMQELGEIFILALPKLSFSAGTNSLVPRHLRHPTGVIHQKFLRYIFRGSRGSPRWFSFYKWPGVGIPHIPGLDPGADVIFQDLHALVNFAADSTASSAGPRCTAYCGASKSTWCAGHGASSGGCGHSNGPNGGGMGLLPRQPALFAHWSWIAEF